MENKNQKRFVLIHGLCHGAWCWFKVKPILEAAGHTVTAVNLAASGINTTRLQEIQTLEDYCKPLLDVLSSPDEDKVILVSHSMGGISAAFAADAFPHKIASIVFVTSFMPDTRNPPAYTFSNFMTSIPEQVWSDTVLGSYGRAERPIKSALLGPKFLAKHLYQLSPVEDLELAKTLVRVNPSITDNLAGTRSFTEEGYGSVARIYIICEEDNIISKEYQHWIISNFPPKEVIKIKDADHMPMNSTPQELCARLLEIADKYA